MIRLGNSTNGFKMLDMVMKYSITVYSTVRSLGYQELIQVCMVICCLSGCLSKIYFKKLHSSSLTICSLHQRRLAYVVIITMSLRIVLAGSDEVQRLVCTVRTVRARDDLTLFCHIYNVFLMFLIDLFVLNSIPMSASLSIFVDLRSKVNFKVKYNFSRNEARNLIFM